MAKPITPHQVRQMDHIVTAHDAHRILARGIRRSNAGCKSWEETEQNCRLFLVAALLTVLHDPTLTIGGLMETLTEGMSNKAQMELDVLERIGEEMHIKVAPTSFEWITRQIRNRLNWTPAMVPDITMEERLTRKATTLDVVHALIQSTLMVDLDEIKMMSVDSTAIEAFAAKSPRLYKTSELLPDSAYEVLDPGTAAVIARKQGRSTKDIRRLSKDPNATGGIPTNDSLGLARHHGLTAREIESSILRMTSSADPDGQYSGKTPSGIEHGTKKGDPDGHTKIYFGKQLNLVTSVRNPTAKDAKKQADHNGEPINCHYRPTSRIPKTNIPHLVLALEVVPAGQAQADPAMRGIDRALSLGVKPELVVSDAEFSSSAEEVWAQPLRDRGIGQVLTLRRDQLGFTEYEGALVRGNEVYCPSADFASIEALPRPRPRPVKSDADRDAFNAEMEEFHDSRNRQAQYLSYIRRNNPDGGIQVTCCARNGDVGCPLVTGSVEAATELGLPIISNPPAPENQGKLCKQNFVTVPVTVTGKLAQRYPFGSDEWEELNRGRSSVEGVNGSIKSPHTSGLRRGVHEFTGLAWDNLFAGLAAALHNYRVLNNWYEIFEPDLKHILVARSADGWHGWDLHTKQAALAAAIGATTDKKYSFEFITHTCDRVRPSSIVRTHGGPDGDPHGYTDTTPTTEIWDDQCDRPDCRVIHTYGGVIELVDLQHEHAVSEEVSCPSQSVARTT